VDVSTSAELVDIFGRAAFELPLPPHWSEEVSDTGVVYFWHKRTGEARWEHPLLQVFVTTLGAAIHVLAGSATVANVVAGLSGYLKEAEVTAKASLRAWVGPYPVEGDAAGVDPANTEFYYNEETQESCWDNPKEVAQCELRSRHFLIERFLHSYYCEVGNGAPVGGVYEQYSAPEHADSGMSDAPRDQDELPEEIQNYAESLQKCIARTAGMSPAGSRAGTPSTGKRESRAGVRRPPLPPLATAGLSGSLSPKLKQGREQRPLAPSRTSPHLARLADGGDSSPVVLQRRTRHRSVTMTLRGALPPLTQFPLRPLPQYEDMTPEMQMAMVGEATPNPAHASQPLSRCREAAVSGGQLFCRGEPSSASCALAEMVRRDSLPSLPQKASSPLKDSRDQQSPPESDWSQSSAKSDVSWRQREEADLAASSDSAQVCVGKLKRPYVADDLIIGDL